MTPSEAVPSPAAESRSLMSRHWIPATVLGLGALSILMLIGTNWIRERWLAQDTALVEALRQIQTLEAISHLWLEEFVTGDGGHITDFWKAQTRSHELMRAILEGGVFGTARVARPPIDEPGLRAEVEQIARQVDAFQQIARERYEGYQRGEEVWIGSPIDERYDTAFGSMLFSMQALEARVDSKLALAHRRSQTLFRAMLATWSILVVLSVLGLYRLERHRASVEHALRASDAKLHRAQKMEAVGRLAGGMAHDINNYLAAITAQCELVKLRPEDAGRTLRRMDTVLGSIDKAATLIRRLLAFSRREMVRPEVVNLNRVVRDIRPMLQVLLGETIDFETRLADPLPNVTIDPAQLEQAIVNLAVNAKEAMPTGGRLTVTTEAREFGTADARPRDVAPGHYVVLTVEDEGCGIPAELREQIFEPFFTTKASSGSSGLGLATVYGVVKQNSGAISLESSPGGGSAFSIYLRATEDPSRQKTVTREPPLEPGDASILVVEDNPELLDSVRESLELLGYRVVTAPHGADALEKFERDPAAIDLVITDVVMPGMGGKDLAAAIHKHRLELPVIFVSGYTDDEMIRHGVSSREVHLVSKPFSIGALLRKVQEVLRAEGAGP